MYLPDCLDPLVSVTLGAYNHKPYIREAIESVLNQTYKNLELIISDDAFMPEKLARQVEYLEKHPETGAVLTRVAVIDKKGRHFRTGIIFTIKYLNSRTEPAMSG